MPIAFHYAARSDVGMVRAENEDSGYAGPHLLAMADGMGGHAGGEIASSTVIAALVDLDIEALSGAEASEALIARIVAANSELGELAKAEPELEGMGTTLIAILRARDKLVLAHIGDSRAFLARGGEVTQITKDHSFVQVLVDEGRITQDEAGVHPQRSLVTRVLTGQSDDEPDLVVRRAKAGDRYLICSDGLSDYVARDTIDSVLLKPSDPGDCADQLVALALRAGAPDNVTVVIGDVIDITAGQLPSTDPQVVGAAAARRVGTRPIPTTPAAKAAALTRAATNTETPADDVLQLAEEGPRSRSARLLRALAMVGAVAIVVFGGAYAAWSWVQSQYFVGIAGDKVAIYQGLNSSAGSLRLYQEQQVTGVLVNDLPELYVARLGDGIPKTTLEDAKTYVADLELQATACRYARTQQQPCQQVEPTWVQPTPSPTATPTTTPSATPATPKVSPSATSVFSAPVLPPGAATATTSAPVP